MYQKYAVFLNNSHIQYILIQNSASTVNLVIFLWFLKIPVITTKSWTFVYHKVQNSGPGETLSTQSNEIIFIMTDKYIFYILVHVYKSIVYKFCRLINLWCKYMLPFLTVDCVVNVAVVSSTSGIVKTGNKKRKPKHLWNRTNSYLE